MCACVGSCVRVWCAVGVVCGEVVWWCVSVAASSLKPHKFCTMFGGPAKGGDPGWNQDWQGWNQWEQKWDDTKNKAGMTGGEVGAVLARPHASSSAHTGWVDGTRAPQRTTRDSSPASLACLDWAEGGPCCVYAEFSGERGNRGGKASQCGACTVQYRFLP